ncbi:hypothetical protein GCM10008090_32110 [Arenicella chitinivorans]|uniref:Uncharacterized protein n=1 Tax=Arenicella chitinivorans TaxID=1329800 RepID=A0A918S208_9GAMM|nr:M23/M56 family metallopeptidase [Arenicella chitinivorans]GHA19913.1 hypothetical protein GCM10008090_32110 [Arenicella chitinivorans]
MITALVFSWAVFITSTTMFLLLGLLSKFSTRVRQSSLVWASALVAVVLIAGLSSWWYFVPSLSPSRDLVVLTDSPLLAAVGRFNWQATNTSVAPAVGRGQMLMTIWTVVYLAGVALCLLRLWFGRRRAAHIANSAIPDTLNSVQDIWLTEQLVSPCVLRCGWLGDYRIVLPRTLASGLTEAQLRMVIAHEQAHIRRCDDQVGLLLRLVVSLSWFSPFMHRLFAAWAEAIEIQCDQAVVATKSRSQRCEYVHTLVKTMRFTQQHNDHLPVATFVTTSIRREKMRICLALGDRPYRALGRVAKVLILISTFAGSAVGGMALSSGMPKEGLPASVDNAITQQIAMLHEGRHTSGFGLAKHPFKPGKQRNHTGVDIAAPKGTLIHAPADGIILTATDLYKGMPKYGKVVVLESDSNTQTLLAHLDDYMVEVGQRVMAGQPIATIGNTGQTTGPHVHIETRLNGERVDPHTIWNLPQPK